MPTIRLVMAAVIWLGVLLSRRLEWAELLLLAGVASTLPLAIELLARRDQTEKLRESRCLTALRWSWFPAWLTLAAALLLTPGDLVFVCLGPFAGVTLLFAANAIRDLVRNRWSTARILVAIGQLYYPVSALALYVWKLDIELFGLPLGIIMLTSLHFHFAGLLMPLLLGELNQRIRSPIFDTLSLLTVASVPLVGLGIAAFPLLEFLSSLLLASALLIVAGWQMQFAISHAGEDLVSAGLLLISAASLFFSMPLAAIYAYGEFQQIVYLQIPTMIAWHGSLNAIGFCFVGLIAWHKMSDIK